jgi:flagellar biosynthesis/type III secretory pathway chaperone
VIDVAIQEVIRKLEQLDGIHRSLLELAEQKKQVLIGNEVDELSKIVNRESRLIKQVGDCEKEWLQAMVHFLEHKGFRPSPSITVSEVSRLVFNADDKQALLEAQERLMDTIGQLQAMNALNQQLIEQSLAFIDYSLDLMAGSPEQDAVYRNPAGQARASKRKGIFDAKA